MDKKFEVKLHSLFEEILGFSISEEQFYTLNMENSAEWDSLSHVKLIMRLQSDFGFKLSMANLDKCKSVEGIIQLARK